MKYYIDRVRSLYFQFFKKCPLLLLAINILLSFSFFLHRSSFLIFLFIFFNIFSFKSFLYNLSLFILAFFYINASYPNLKVIDKPLQGKGYFKISSIKEISYNKKQIIYRGVLKEFVSNKTYKNLPCTIMIKKDKNAPRTNFYVEGELSSNNKYFYRLKPFSWKSDETSFNLSFLRHDLKKKVEKYLRKNIKDRNVISFLNAMITGSNNNQYLSFAFAKIGLQHIMAISGFHFGLLFLMLSFILNLFVSKKFSLWILIFLLSLYFLFLGPFPSIERSYIMILVALFSQGLNKKYYSINALALSFIVIIIINPLIITNVGFQLSFLSSASILIIYPKIESWINLFIKKRTRPEFIQLNLISQKAYLLLNFIKQGAALSFSVNLMIFPLVLFHFHKFSYLSFIYNLFIPLFVSASILLIFLALLFFYIPLFPTMLNLINTFITKFLLNLIFTTPASIQFYARSKSISLDFVIFYISTILILFISLKALNDKHEGLEFIKFL